jgi:hypothetical protein
VMCTAAILAACPSLASSPFVLLDPGMAHQEPP